MVVSRKKRPCRLVLSLVFCQSASVSVALIASCQRVRADSLHLFAKAPLVSAVLICSHKVSAPFCVIACSFKAFFRRFGAIALNSLLSLIARPSPSIVSLWRFSAVSLRSYLSKVPAFFCFIARFHRSDRLVTSAQPHSGDRISLFSGHSCDLFRYFAPVRLIKCVFCFIIRLRQRISLPLPPCGSVRTIMLFLPDPDPCVLFLPVVLSPFGKNACFLVLCPFLRNVRRSIAPHVPLSRSNAFVFSYYCSLSPKCLHLPALAVFGRSANFSRLCLFSSQRAFVSDASASAHQSACVISRYPRVSPWYACVPSLRRPLFKRSYFRASPLVFFAKTSLLRYLGAVSRECSYLPVSLFLAGFSCRQRSRAIFMAFFSLRGVRIVVSPVFAVAFPIVFWRCCFFYA